MSCIKINCFLKLGECFSYLILKPAGETILSRSGLCGHVPTDGDVGKY
jgi:hypothetical protein